MLLREVELSMQDGMHITVLSTLQKTYTNNFPTKIAENEFKRRKIRVYESLHHRGKVARQVHTRICDKIL